MKKFYKSNFALIISFVIASLGLFYYTYESELNSVGNSSDIVFVLDVSESMNALDYQAGSEAYSRLDVSKDLIKNFVLKYPTNRYSLTIFSGDFSEIVPFTSDASLFLTFLQNADSKSIVRGGNVLREAFVSSLERFKSEETSGAIIVLSDFEFPGKDKTFLDNYLGNLTSVKKDLRDNNIKVFSIGAGSQRGNNIPLGMGPFGNMNYKEDMAGNRVLTKFDDTIFNEFSSILNSIKFKINNYNDYKNIVSKITDLPSRNIETSMSIQVDFSRYFMIISYVILIFYMIFYYLERRKIKS